jgi:hypothetical protein
MGLPVVTRADAFQALALIETGEDYALTQQSIEVSARL